MLILDYVKLCKQIDVSQAKKKYYVESLNISRYNIF